ncbi:MAG: hypothetical protein WC758_07710 [Candidatus Woesearchaeota archaeon]|jgi:hypothetical protein
MKTKNKSEEYSEGFENYFEDEKDKGNTVIIAGRPIEVYTQVIIEKLQRFDQIIIKVADKYRERALRVVALWQAVGVMPTRDYTRSNGSIFFTADAEDITPKDGKPVYRKNINKMVLSKIPDLFRFTNLNI